MRVLRRLVVALRLAVTAALLACAGSALALDRDGVIALIRRGAPAEEVLRSLRATGVASTPDARELLDLHRAGVPDAVILEMIRLGRQSGDRVAAPADPPAPSADSPAVGVEASPSDAAAEASRAPVGSDADGRAAPAGIAGLRADDGAVDLPPGAGLIRFTNEDVDRICVLARDDRSLLLYAGSSQVNPTVRREETCDFPVAPGRWRIVWLGEEDGVALEVAAGRVLHVVTRRARHELVAVLWADVYDGTRFVESRCLRTFPLYSRPARTVCAEAGAPGPSHCDGAVAGAGEPAGSPRRTEYASERVTGYAEK